ncbi:MAG: DUF2158 domain-containing protein [Rhodospirillaceae bacterium]|nr:DUF2158 domain-containing protein [Rhodospirillaceae bacterium]MYF86477.1 DUF2158 domain-containing protein [Rhodospirillaceae bacterium]MYH38155.1 DUF2158 domain-containing protein [Rhodospirillaceae bacterium]MYK14786.1 DUF2158 domain-containing protein [Rhodospirillaceae bacterium]
MTTVKPGAKVRLKSGGPMMTVSSLQRNRDGQSDKAFCNWYEDKDIKTKPLSLDVLELVPDDESPDWKIAPAIGS